MKLTDDQSLTNSFEFVLLCYNKDRLKAENRMSRIS